MLFVQETAKSRAELLVKTLDDKDQGKMPVMLIYGEKDVDLTFFTLTSLCTFSILFSIHFLSG